MSSVRRPAEPAAPGQRDQTRRGFLRAAGVVGAASLVAVPPSSPGSLPAGERLMILQVARAGAAFPIEFPGFDEPGPAVSRATATRLRGATRRASGPRLALARSGARTLIAQGLLDHTRPRLVQGIGRLADDPAAQRELTAVAALAIATVSSHFDPDSDHAAQRWIGGLRELHRRAWPAGRNTP